MTAPQSRFRRVLCRWVRPATATTVLLAAIASAPAPAVEIRLPGNAAYLTTFTRAKLLRVAVKEGQPGRVTELIPSRPLTLADGLRPMGDGSFLLAEGGGRVDRMTVSETTARIDVLEDGITGGVTGVTFHGTTAYATIGQLAVVTDPARKGTRPNLPFRVIAVPLTAP